MARPYQRIAGDPKVPLNLSLPVSLVVELEVMAADTGLGVSRVVADILRSSIKTAEVQPNNLQRKHHELSAR